MVNLLRCPLAIVGWLVDTLLTARVARRAALCVDAHGSPEQVLADYEAEVDALEAVGFGHCPQCGHANPAHAGHDMMCNEIVGVGGDGCAVYCNCYLPEPEDSAAIPRRGNPLPGVERHGRPLPGPPPPGRAKPPQ